MSDTKNNNQETLEINISVKNSKGDEVFKYSCSRFTQTNRDKLIHFILTELEKD